MLDIQINEIHSDAVCQEIGERLSSALGRQSNELPDSLLVLIERLARSETPSETRPDFDA
jgi:hypothetical protein